MQTTNTAESGGATIADRFKLDLSDPSEKRPAAAGVGAKVAVVAGFVALAAVGLLVFKLWGHWEFLMPA